MQGKKTAFFVASSGQHVGKTTTCLGLIAGLKSSFSSIGFMKPVGQETILARPGVHADKDVVLFKKYFNFEEPAEVMSPVLIQRGFTRDYLDGKASLSGLIENIQSSFATIASKNECVIVEGTGHVGVGSICDINNAKVAKLLNLDIILILSGGLGSAFDSLMLNKALCDSYGVSIQGVILNKVLPEKKSMIETYFTKALKKLNIPLLGTLPYTPLLSKLSMLDLSSLLNAPFLSGIENALFHPDETKLIATSLSRFRQIAQEEQLIITPAIREDILFEILKKYWDCKLTYKRELKLGIVLTGSVPPSDKLSKQLKETKIPTLYCPENSFDITKKITSFTAKIRLEDTEKIKEAIAVTQAHIDFNLLMESLQR